jgi:hypothetical protein
VTNHQASPTTVIERKANAIAETRRLLGVKENPQYSDPTRGFSGKHFSLANAVYSKALQINRAIDF